MMVAMLEVGDLWARWLWPIIQLVVGLGMVVFVHELGHFVVAKLAGIKVDQFALGFGPRLIGIRKGETEYRLNILPLGGYVHMVGQEDFKPNQEQTDPGAFNNKSVAARIAVVSAGVAMNAVFAAALFVTVCLVGIRFPAPIIGGVLPGYPAAQARIHWIGPADRNKSQANDSQNTTGDIPTESQGLQPGDRILRIEGRSLLLKILGSRVSRFTTLPLLAALSSGDDVYTMTIQRRFDDVEVAGVAQVGVKAIRSETGGDRFAFGLLPASSTRIGDVQGYLSMGPFESSDVITSINGKAIEFSWQIPRALEAKSSARVDITVLREGKTAELSVDKVLYGGSELVAVFKTDQSRIYGKVVRYEDDAFVISQTGEQLSIPNDQIISIEPAEMLSILGMVPRIRVSAVEKSKPADRAGVLPGDIIVDYGDRGTPTLRGLFEINEESAERGTSIVVQRDGTRSEPMWIVPVWRAGKPVLGISPTVNADQLVLAGVEADSPAQRAGLGEQDVIEMINDQPVENWSDLLATLCQMDPQREVVVSFRRGAQLHKAELGKLADTGFDRSAYSWSLPGVRGYEPVMGPLVRTSNPGLAMAWGMRETVHFLATTYATLNNWIRGNLSHKEFAGPVGIGWMAIQASRRSSVDFMYFLAIISVSLVVVNFLPLPVVDGGLVVFLIIEKLRGRPIPLKVQNIVQTIGLALIACVFLAITWQDVSRLFQGLW